MKFLGGLAVGILVTIAIIKIFVYPEDRKSTPAVPTLVQQRPELPREQTPPVVELRQITDLPPAAYAEWEPVVFNETTGRDWIVPYDSGLPAYGLLISAVDPDDEHTKVYHMNDSFANAVPWVTEDNNRVDWRIMSADDKRIAVNLFNFTGDKTSIDQFRVSARGKWELTLAPLTRIPTLDLNRPYTGSGPTIFRLLQTPLDVHLEAVVDSERTFSGRIEFFTCYLNGSFVSPLFREPVPYDGLIHLPADTWLVEVNTDAIWQITVQAGDPESSRGTADVLSKSPTPMPSWSNTITPP